MLLAVLESSAIDQKDSVDQDGPVEHGDPVDSSLVGKLDGVANALNGNDVVEGAIQSSADVHARLSGDEPGDMPSIDDNDDAAGNSFSLWIFMVVPNVIKSMV